MAPGQQRLLFLVSTNQFVSNATGESTIEGRGMWHPHLARDSRAGRPCHSSKLGQCAERTRLRA